MIRQEKRFEDNNNNPNNWIYMVKQESVIQKLGTWNGEMLLREYGFVFSRRRSCLFLKKKKRETNKQKTPKPLSLWSLQTLICL